MFFKNDIFFFFTLIYWKISVPFNSNKSPLKTKIIGILPARSVLKKGKKYNRNYVKKTAEIKLLIIDFPPRLVHFTKKKVLIISAFEANRHCDLL